MVDGMREIEGIEVFMELQGSIGWIGLMQLIGAMDSKD